MIFCLKIPRSENKVTTRVRHTSIDPSTYNVPTGAKLSVDLSNIITGSTEYDKNKVVQYFQ